MTTLKVDENDGCMMGTLLPPPPDWVPPTIAESLEHGFDGEADRALCDDGLRGRLVHSFR